MTATSKFVGMHLLLILVVFSPLHSAENPVSITLDSVAEPFGKHALSYPKEAIGTVRRGIELLIDNTDDEESKPGRNEGSNTSHVADFIFPPSVSNIKFAYDEEKSRDDGSDGILAVFGFSNNPCSLLKQLGYSNFSYCFAPNSSQSSVILLGSDFAFRENNFNLETAQLVQNYQFPSSYSVNLTGIVGFQTKSLIQDHFGEPKIKIFERKHYLDPCLHFH